jgi:hypothetical protein
MDRSIHDNYIVGYEVDCERQVIRLRTEFRDVPVGEAFEKTDLVFQDVEAYHFIGDNFATIIFDVAEIAAEELLRDEVELFRSGREFCWPGPWNTSDVEALAHFRSRGVHAYVLHSSYGMGGWILAQSMTMIDVDKLATDK